MGEFDVSLSFINARHRIDIILDLAILYGFAVICYSCCGFRCHLLFHYESFPSPPENWQGKYDWTQS